MVGFGFLEFHLHFITNSQINNHFQRLLCCQLLHLPPTQNLRHTAINHPLGTTPRRPSPAYYALIQPPVLLSQNVHERVHRRAQHDRLRRHTRQRYPHEARRRQPSAQPNVADDRSQRRPALDEGS